MKDAAVAQRTTIILIGLVLLSLFAVAAQHLQLRQLVEVDCAAYQERLGRAILYDSLAQHWDDRDPMIADAYRTQRDAVVKVAAKGKRACD